jgi:hypothetical protein
MVSSSSLKTQAMNMNQLMGMDFSEIMKREVVPGVTTKRSIDLANQVMDSLPAAGNGVDVMKVIYATTSDPDERAATAYLVASRIATDYDPVGRALSEVERASKEN